MQDTPELARDWLQWWHHGYWLQADDSWCPPRFAALPAAQQQRFLQQHATVWQHALAIPDAPIGTPQPLVLTLASLPASARSDVLLLIAEICGCATALPSEIKIWCRRLARALRPESWLPPDLYAGGCSAHSLRLLQALWPDVWPRLKLLFAQSDVRRCYTVPSALSDVAHGDAVHLPQLDVTHCDTRCLHLPGQRLRPLLEAVLWQCQRQTRDREHTCVET